MSDSVLRDNQASANQDAGSQIVENTFALMDQIPEGDIVGASPLHHADLEKLASMPPDRQGVLFKELKLMGHFTLRLDATNTEQVKQAESILSFPLPLQPLTTTVKEESCARWISPDEWLITVPGCAAFELESAFRQKMQGHYSIVNGSGGVTMIHLSGDHAVDVMKKSSPVDFHLSAFPVGKVVSTVFAKSSAVIRRIETNHFELIIRRSFADYLWLWLQDASLEYGLAIQK